MPSGFGLGFAIGLGLGKIFITHGILIEEVDEDSRLLSLSVPKTSDIFDSLGTDDADQLCELLATRFHELCGYVITLTMTIRDEHWTKKMSDDAINDYLSKIRDMD